MSGRNKFSDLREGFLNDPERGAERREEVEKLGRAYDALIAQHETQEPLGDAVVGKEDRPEDARNRPQDPERRGAGEHGRHA